MLLHCKQGIRWGKNALAALDGTAHRHVPNKPDTIPASRRCRARCVTLCRRQRGKPHTTHAFASTSCRGGVPWVTGRALAACIIDGAACDSGALHAVGRPRQGWMGRAGREAGGGSTQACESSASCCNLARQSQVDNSHTGCCRYRAPSQLHRPCSRSWRHRWCSW